MANRNQTSWRYDPKPFRLQVAAATDVGHVRSRNEDRAFVEAGCFGVCDGMGGVGGGDVAAETASTEFVRSIRDGYGPMAAVDAAHSGVISAADAPRGVKGMGATLCAGVFGTVGEAPSMAIVNVGDSRAYLAREGEPLRLLTKDQRWVQTQVDAGVLTPEEARVHSHRNILTSVVGGVGAYNPSVEYITPRTGDKFIFCTDGITEELSDELFERSIQTAANFEQLAKELVKAVLEGSARDNATVLVVSVLESPQLSA